MKSIKLPMLRTAIIGLGIAALGGCAALRQHALSSIPADEAQPAVTAAFPDTAPQGLRYGGPESFQNYLMYKAHGARAEMIYTRTLSPRAGIYFPWQHLRQLSEGWRFVAAADPAWGEVEQARSAIGPVRYRTFKARDRHCAAFNARWDLASGLPAQLPTKTVFGYYCAAPGAALATMDIDRVLGSLRPRRPDKLGVQTVARLNPEQQSGGMPYGRNDFPLLFTVNTSSERASDSNN